MSQEKSRYPMFAYNPEVKAVDLPTANYNLDTTGSIICLNSIREGSSYFERIGRTVVNRSLRLIGYVVPQTGGTLEGFGRVLVVYDKQTNGVAPTWANVIQSISSTGTTSSGVVDPINLDNRERFIVVYDKMWQLPGPPQMAPNALLPTNALVVNKYIRLGESFTTQYNASTVGVGSISTGSLYLLTFGTNVNTFGHFLSVGCRLRFTD